MVCHQQSLPYLSGHYQVANGASVHDGQHVLSIVCSSRVAQAACRQENLKLIFVRALEQLAHAARSRADAIHESFVFFALLVLSPTLAALVVVHAHRRANPAGFWALLHHRERVILAFASVGPNLALGAVIVSTLDSLTYTAAQRAFLEPANVTDTILK